MDLLLLWLSNQDFHRFINEIQPKCDSWLIFCCVFFSCDFALCCLFFCLYLWYEHKFNYLVVSHYVMVMNPERPEGKKYVDFHQKVINTFCHSYLAHIAGNFLNLNKFYFKPWPVLWGWCKITYTLGVDGRFC